MRHPIFTDDTVMPFGPHKGKHMKDVPAEHLLWLLDQPWIKGRKELHSYIVANKATLMEQVAAQNKLRGDVDDAPPLDTFEDYRKHYRGF